MKKGLILIPMLAFFGMSVSAGPIKPVRLTVVNKSGLPLEIRLTGENDNSYYLRVPTGNREFPTEQKFSIVPDTYRMQPYYIELWDPVYGYRCGGAGTKTVYAQRNIKITFLECNYTPRHRGGTFNL